jgi:hypothetical protein
MALGEWPRRAQHHLLVDDELEVDADDVDQITGKVGCLLAMRPENWPQVRGGI